MVSRPSVGSSDDELFFFFLPSEFADYSMFSLYRPDKVHVVLDGDSVSLPLPTKSFNHRRARLLCQIQHHAQPRIGRQLDFLRQDSLSRV